MSLFPKLKIRLRNKCRPRMIMILYTDKSKNLTSIAELFQANASNFSLFPYWYRSAYGFFKFASLSIKRVAHVLFSKSIFFALAVKTSQSAEHL